MKKHVVEIRGHKYRYGYKDGETVYLGPVGDAPPIPEQEFIDEARKIIQKMELQEEDSLQRLKELLDRAEEVSIRPSGLTKEEMVGKKLYVFEMYPSAWYGSDEKMYLADNLEEAKQMAIKDSDYDEITNRIKGIESEDSHDVEVIELTEKGHIYTAMYVE